MTGIVVDLDIDLLAQLLHRRLELVQVVVGRDAMILAAEQAEDRRVDSLDGLGVGGEMAVVDHICGESRLL